LEASEPLGEEAEAGSGVSGGAGAAPSRLRRRKGKGGEEEKEKEKKLSAKQQAKLAAKAQKKQQASLRELDKKRREEDLNAFWKEKEQERQAERRERAEQEAEDQKLKAEMERREVEEFEAWKDQIEVAESGSGVKSAAEREEELQEFIAAIKRDKVVLLESLASQWDLSTAEVLERLEQLEERGVFGILDERGMFIHVTEDELNSIAGFINRKGRIKMQSLAQSLNHLIELK
jgi:hypothetical protein